MKDNVIITIARQCGSGGREIGERLAEVLGYKKYGRELVSMCARETNMSEKVLEEADERPASSLLYTLVTGSFMNSGAAGTGSGFHVPINDKLFIAQSDIIRRLAAEESCIFVGRCADYVLRENDNVIKIFIYGDIDFRKKRVAEQEGISEVEAAEIIAKTDKKRASYYNFYTGGKWGRLENYSLTINSAVLGIEGTVKMIADFVEAYKNS